MATAETGVTAAREVFPADLVRRVPVFFSTRKITFLTGTNGRYHWNGARPILHAECHSRTPFCASAGGQSPSAGCGACEQILDGFADLHELIQTGRLGDELGNSKILEQGLVAPGPGRTPHAHGNAVEVSGASDLAQDVFAGILGQVQVHQDQAWNGRIRISPLSADESEAVASVQQVNQFKLEILLLQRPIEKEDVRAVVFNDKDAGGANNRNVFQAPSWRANLRWPLFIIPQSMVSRPAVTPVWP